MRPCILLAGLIAFPLVAGAQSDGHEWRFGANISAPSHLLSNGTNHLTLGIGVGFEAMRVLARQGPTSATVDVRFSTAPINGTGSSNSWKAGQAYVADATLRAERTGERTGAFIGGGFSHWGGASSVSPIAGAASFLLAAEAGAFTRAGDGPWKIVGTVHLTKFDVYNSRNMGSGAVTRVLIGVQRDY
jgi:hypothetical protein